MEAEKQLKDRKVYQEVKFSENILTDVVEKSNTMFKNLRRKSVITERKLKSFCVPGRPVISVCGTPTEKVSNVF